MSLVLAVSGYVALAALRPTGFEYSSVCTDCGLIESTVERRLPFTSFTIQTSHGRQATALSACFARNGFRVGHVHHWSFGSGGDFGFTHSCAIGPGRWLYYTANDSDVANLADGLIRFGDSTDRERWIGLFLEPDTTISAKMAVASAALPSQGFADRETFRKW